MNKLEKMLVKGLIYGALGLSALGCGIGGDGGSGTEEKTVDVEAKILETLPNPPNYAIDEVFNIAYQIANPGETSVSSTYEITTWPQSDPSDVTVVKTDSFSLPSGDPGSPSFEPYSYSAADTYVIEIVIPQQSGETNIGNNFLSYNVTITP